MGGPAARPGPAGGFTLLEVLVVLALVAALVALAAPGLVGFVEAERERGAGGDAERIYRAIVGSPGRGEFGYLGDMGRLPSALTELVEQGSQPPFTTTGNVGGVGTGWRGPYLSGPFATADLLRDPWGHPFSYTGTGPAAGQVVSGGPDGDVGTAADNLVFPVHPPATTGTLHVAVLVNAVPDPLGASAKLYSPVDGRQAVTPTQKHLETQPFDGFAFENVTHGLHVLVVAHTGRRGGQCVTVSRTVTVAVPGGQSVVTLVHLLTEADVRLRNQACPVPD